MSPPFIFQSQVFTRKLFAFAGNSLLIYDYLLTLALEVSYIWNEPWSLVKTLFLINRYGNLAGQTFIMLEETGHLSRGSRRFCLSFQIFYPLFAFFSGESIRIFVVMRTYAILKLRRSIALAVIIMYILYVIVVIALSAYLLLLLVGSAQFEYLHEVGICVLPITDPNICLFWLIPLLLDGFIFVLVCHSLRQFLRDSRGIHPSPLIRLLARDALLFYFAALFNVLFGILCWTIYSEDPRNLLQVLFACPVLTVVGQRFVLNPRRLRAQPDSTRDLSREVNRQIAAMAEDTSWVMELDSVG